MSRHGSNLHRFGDSGGWLGRAAGGCWFRQQHWHMQHRQHQYCISMVDRWIGSIVRSCVVGSAPWERGWCPVFWRRPARRPVPGKGNADPCHLVHGVQRLHIDVCRTRSSIGYGGGHSGMFPCFWGGQLLGTLGDDLTTVVANPIERPPIARRRRSSSSTLGTTRCGSTRTCVVGSGTWTVVEIDWTLADDLDIDMDDGNRVCGYVGNWHWV